MIRSGVEFLDETLGALEIGVLVSSLLYGFTCGQVYLFATSPKDRPLIVTMIVAFVLYAQNIYIFAHELIDASGISKPFTWRALLPSQIHG